MKILLVAIAGGAFTVAYLSYLFVVIVKAVGGSIRDLNECEAQT